MYFDICKKGEVCRCGKTEKTIYDFLNSIDQLECNLLLQAKANKVYIFHEELDILDGFDASRYSVEGLKQEIETFLSMGAPK